MSVSSLLRQSPRRTQEATRLFFGVRLHEDQFIAVTPGKAIQQLPPASLNEGSDCQVKWSDGKVYKAMVFAIEGEGIYTCTITMKSADRLLVIARACLRMNSSVILTLLTCSTNFACS